MPTFFAILTAVGEAKDANAKALGIPLVITEMAVGDGNGVVPVPDRTRTTLVNQVRRAALNQLSRDPVNTNQVIAEQVIPENVGGWWIREIGLYDQDGDLIAIANCPPTYKPQLAEGSGRTQVVRMVLIMSGADAVQLKIDPAIVLATRKYADDAITASMNAHLAAADPHPQYLTSAEGDAKVAAHTAEADPHPQYMTPAEGSAAYAPLGNVFKNFQHFAANGTFVVPAGVTTVMVEVWGGGGGGGSSGPNLANTSGGGGGAGAYAKSILTVTPGQSIAVTIGANGGGAVAGSTGGNGINGGTSSFGSYVTCTGGQGGYSYGSGSYGGVGGNVSVGGNVCAFKGADGGSGTYSGTSTGGTPGGTGGGPAGGSGGSSNTPNPGRNGGRASGGGGGATYGSLASNAGDGGQGQIIVYW